MDERAEYYDISALAIRAGLLTPNERDVIARVGKRKQNYWSRHLRDLREILEMRVEGKSGPEINLVKRRLGMDLHEVDRQMRLHGIDPTLIRPRCSLCGEVGSIVGFIPPNRIQVICTTVQCANYSKVKTISAPSRSYEPLRARYA